MVRPRMVRASGNAGGLPGILPVADGSFIAYSCAAARDLHPLPCLRRAAKTRVPNKMTKIRMTVAKNLTGEDGGSQCCGAESSFARRTAGGACPHITFPITLPQDETLPGD